jgi:hypothetical protein
MYFLHKVEMGSTKNHQEISKIEGKKMEMSKY